MFRDGPTGSNTCPCETRYVDVGVSLCQPCESYIYGCKVCASTISCTECLPGFTENSIETCSCTSGNMVTGVCTNITGCTSATQFNNIVYCMDCNASLNYVLSGYTCVCSTGFTLDSNELCVSTCGDSKKTAGEGCDDGNTASGDGCSSSCLVETNWACFNGSVTTASVCLINNTFTMTVKYVRRVLTGNIMKVGIKIEPKYDQFTQINFKDYFTSDVPSTNYNATYVDGLLILDFEYDRTIEGEDFTALMVLNPAIFYNANVAVAIPASGMNAQLTYDSYYQANYPLQIIVIVLDVLAVLVLFASVLSERMIGIEMIQTLQSCLFLQMVVKTLPSSLAPLSNLQYSNGYNDIYTDDPARTYTFAFSLSTIGLEKEFILSFNIMYILLGVVVIACIILKLRQTLLESRAEKITDEREFEYNEVKWEKTTKNFYFVFERVLFVVGFMSMFLVIAATMIQITDMSADYTLVSKELNMMGGGIAIAVIATLLCAVIITGIYPNTLLFPMLLKQYYPPIYFIYQSTFIFICAFMYTQDYILYILAAMSFLFLIYNAVHRPYPEKFHTFVLIFHQVVILAVILLFIFQVKTAPREN